MKKIKILLSSILLLTSCNNQITNNNSSVTPISVSLDIKEIKIDDSLKEIIKEFSTYNEYLITYCAYFNEYYESTGRFLKKEKLTEGISKILSFNLKEDSNNEVTNNYTNLRFIFKIKFYFDENIRKSIDYIFYDTYVCFYLTQNDIRKLYYSTYEKDYCAKLKKYFLDNTLYPEEYREIYGVEEAEYGYGI